MIGHDSLQAAHGVPAHTADPAKGDAIPKKTDYKAGNKLEPKVHADPIKVQEQHPAPYKLGAAAADAYANNDKPSPAFPPMTCTGGYILHWGISVTLSWV